MVYLELLMTDSVDYASENYKHRAYLELPDDCVSVADGRAELTEIGTERCKGEYSSRYGWDPEYGNYKLVPLSEGDVTERMPKAMEAYKAAKAELELLTKAYWDIAKVRQTSTATYGTED
jgi:hypothetical protein